MIRRDGLWYTIKRSIAWFISHTPLAYHASFLYYQDTRLVFAPSMLTYRIFADRKTRSGDIKAMEENIKTGDIVIDIGANAGTFTIIAAKLAGHSGRVMAFEPSPKFSKIIQSNINVNKFNDFVTVHQVAMGATPGTVYLNEMVADDTTNYVSGSGTSVPQATLDSFTKNIDVIDLIKIDAEGSELEVLKGAEESLCKTRILLFEICNKTLNRNRVNVEELYQMLIKNFNLYYKHGKAPFILDPKEDYNTDLIGYSKHI